MKIYEAKHHIGIGNGHYAPGEVIDEELTDKQAMRLLRAGAIRVVGIKVDQGYKTASAPEKDSDKVPDLAAAGSPPEGDSAEPPEDDSAEPPEEPDEDEEAAPVPEIDVTDGIGTAPKADKKGGKKK